MNRQQENNHDNEQEPWDWTEEELHKVALQRRKDLEALAIIFLFLVVILLKLAPVTGGGA